MYIKSFSDVCNYVCHINQLASVLSMYIVAIWECIATITQGMM